MSWIGWTVIGILCANALFFGALFVWFYISERRRTK